jgi:hypothetical protein
MRYNEAVSPVVATMLVLLLVFSSVGGILIWALPEVQQGKQVQAAYENAKRQLSILNDAIGDLAQGGTAAQKSGSLAFDQGSLSVDPDEGRTIVMYSLDDTHDFDVSGLDNNDNSFTITMDPDEKITRVMAYWLNDDWSSTPCFLAGTPVALADGGHKAIEDIRVGEVVKTYDETTGCVVPGLVTQVFHHPAETMGSYYLVINQELRVTPDHRISANGQWMRAGDLAIGDSLFTGSGGCKVWNIEKIFDQQPAYDFEVAGSHTYFVSVDGYDVLVHNPVVQPGDTPFLDAFPRLLFPRSLFDLRGSSHPCDTVRIVDKRDDKVDAVPGTRFSVERTIEGTQGLPVHFATLFSPDLVCEKIELAETQDRSKDPGFTDAVQDLGCQVYASGRGVSGVEQRIDTLRERLPSEVQQLDTVAYSDVIRLDGPCTVRMWFKAPGWEDINGGGKSSSGDISFLVFSDTGAFDFEGSSWWESNYCYRKKLTINEISGNKLTNYTVKYTFDHASLVAAHKSLLNGSDIRIVNNTGVEIPRILNGTSNWNTAATTILFKVRTLIASGSTSYYMYYNNPSASTPSYGKKDVYLVYDDFNDQANWDLDKVGLATDHCEAGKWKTTDSYCDSSNIYWIGSLSPEKGSQNWLKDSVCNISTEIGTGGFELKYTTEPGIGDFDVTSWAIGFNNKTEYMQIYAGIKDENTGGYSWQIWAKTTPTDRSAVYRGSSSTWTIYRTETGQVKIYANGALFKTGSNGNALYKLVIASGRHYSSGCYPYNHTRSDYVQLRKYVSHEPTVTAGSEEDRFGPPQINIVEPQNGATSINLVPPLKIKVKDTGCYDLVNVTWYGSSDGGVTWINFGTNYSVDARSGFVEVQRINSNFNGYQHIYYWNVSVTDGHNTNNSPIYNFTTGPPWIVKKDATSPSTASSNGRKLVRTSNGDLHCVYYRTSGGVSNIFYANSTDNGEHWTETQLTSETNNQVSPAIAVDSNNDLHVVWSGRNATATLNQIRYLTYTTGWSSTITNLTDGTYTQLYPSLAVDSNDYVHVVWYGKYLGTSYYQIRYRSYTGTWNNIIDLTTNYSDQKYPSIAVDSTNNLHVVWRGYDRIRYENYTSSEWGSIKNITENAYLMPSLTVDSNDIVHVVWCGEDTGGGYQIRYMNSTNNWVGTTRDLITESDMQSAPSIATDGYNNLHVVWYGKHAGSTTYTQIRYKKYTQTIGWDAAVTTLTTASTNQQYPNLIWARYPTAQCRPKTGYGFVFCNETAVKYYNSSDLTWNTPPTINNPDPTPNEYGVPRNPTLSVTVNGPEEEDAMTITWYYWYGEQNQWQQFSVNSSVYNFNGTCYQTCSYFSLYNTAYRWMVNVTDGVDTTAGEFSFTTHGLQICAPSDDCDEKLSTGEVRLTGQYIYIGNYGSSSYTGGFRFQDVNISTDRVIGNVTLDLYNYWVPDVIDHRIDQWRAVIKGVKEPYPKNWADGDPPHLRTKTDNTTDWNGASLKEEIMKKFTTTGDMIFWMSSPDIKDIISEIIHQPGWESGDNLSLVIEDNGSALNNYTFPYAYDWGCPSHCGQYGARLTINYVINCKPNASFTWDDTDGGQKGAMIQFYDHSTDDHQAIDKYEWEWNALNSSNLSINPDVWCTSGNVSRSHDYGDNDKNPHLVKLRVTDAGGLWDIMVQLVQPDILEKTPVEDEYSRTVEYDSPSGQASLWYLPGQTTGAITITFMNDVGQEKNIEGTMCIVLYEDTDPSEWNLKAFGLIWIFDSTRLTYQLPSREGTYKIMLENGGIISSTPKSITQVVDGPTAYTDNDAFSLRINQMKASSYGGGTGNLKITNRIGLNCIRESDQAYDLRLRFYGDYASAWLNYFNTTYNFVDLDPPVANTVGYPYPSGTRSVRFRLAQATVFVTVG